MTLLVRQQVGHPACKKKLSGGVLAAATTIHCLASEKSRLVLPFWYRLTWVVPDNWPLNGCLFVCLYLLTFLFYV